MHSFKLKIGSLHPSFENEHIKIQYMLSVTGETGVHCDIPLRIGWPFQASIQEQRIVTAHTEWPIAFVI